VANASCSMSVKPDPEGNAQMIFASFSHPDIAALVDPLYAFGTNRGWDEGMDVYNKF